VLCYSKNKWFDHLGSSEDESNFWERQIAWRRVKGWNATDPKPVQLWEECTVSTALNPHSGQKYSPQRGVCAIQLSQNHKYLGVIHSFDCKQERVPDKQAVFISLSWTHHVLMFTFLNALNRMLLFDFVTLQLSLWDY